MNYIITLYYNIPYTSIRIVYTAYSVPYSIQYNISYSIHYNLLYNIYIICYNL